MINNYKVNSLDLDNCFYHENDGNWIKSDPNPF
jgi:hypothetical protein